ncbi:RNA ligase family protein [Cytobacillus praedii]|uniref:ATP-dependent DNA ligase n=1 Tax=Cytobacillus praedii TaxID=1742358 RepID=A0A4R1AR01_9BACI|nr:RNA ligase family protein [Cytobacillus praedii]TCJ00419.1 ATP-dependent DNA ligase [Cytobacillus praedii]
MFISPMLLHKADQPFNDDSWITELKLDGFRCIWTKFNNKVRIYTRHNNEITSMFPELINIDIPDGTVLDGEIIVSDNEGKPHFEAVMERLKSKKSQHKISFCVFDILYINNIKITNKPLLDRKEILSQVIPEDNNLLTKTQWTHGNGESYFDLVKQLDLEGIVLKRANTKYQTGKRSVDWLKVINYKYANVYVSGLRKDEFGLLLNFEDGSYAGLLEFMPTSNRKEFYKVHNKLIIKENDKFKYLDPKLKMNVKYRNLTSKGLLRIPSFVEWVS